ncbi:hypothetical protein NHF48_005910 [Sphingomonas sp. H160509]|uniref:hypothetical protein n=1 Tax=Sphingomonas sp. H160509 TaxID=2955313 RepID=UPI0020981A94|nr:hypothetical protein [Sphingomonas sp. H160509]MDD1450621.1 hypothetical protein [Sphingomonas sp. H160509]
MFDVQRVCSPAESRRRDADWRQDVRFASCKVAHLYPHAAPPARWRFVDRAGDHVAVRGAVGVGADDARAEHRWSLLGVSLPRSVVTDILSPVVTGIATPVQSTVNPILSNVKSISGVLTVSVLGLPPLVANLPSVPTPALSIDVAGILNDAANNAPLTLSVLNSNGVAVGPNDSCVTQADGFTLRNPAGIAIGGNRITGLGANGFEAFAADPNAIAFGNSARTGAGAVGAIAFGGQAQVADNATGAIALGTGASATAANGVALGAGSVSSRAAATGYTAIGLAFPQNSAGEVSVGAAGAERQITNVAAGTAATDAVNVAQLTGVQAQIGTLASGAVQYDGATRTSVTLGEPVPARRRWRCATLRQARSARPRPMRSTAASCSRPTPTSRT